MTPDIQELDQTLVKSTQCYSDGCVPANMEFCVTAVSSKMLEPEMLIVRFCQSYISYLGHKFFLYSRFKTDKQSKAKQKTADQHTKRQNAKLDPLVPTSSNI